MRLRKGHGEQAWLAGLLFLLLLVHLLTLTRLPIVAIDEVSYSDPGVNLALGHGFVSTAWYAQTASSFFAGNTPLYPLLVALWLNLLGFSMVAVRLLNVTLSLFGLVMAWVAVKRLGLIRSPEPRLLFVLLLGTGTGMIFTFRFGRYDTLMLIVFLVAVLAFSLESEALRLSALFAVGVAFPFAGLPLVAYVMLLSVLLLLFVGRRLVFPFLATGLGVVAGGALLYGLYKLRGVWSVFSESVSQHTAGGWQWPAFDPSTLVILALLLAWNGNEVAHGTWRLHSFVFFALVAGIAIPIGVAVLGKYPLPYSWMAYTPMTACLCAALDRHSGRNSSRLVRVSVSAALGAAVLVGLPAYATIVALEWRARDYKPVDQLAARHVRPSDIVYCEWGAYYAAKGRAANVVLPTYGAGWEGMKAAFEGAAPIPTATRRAVTLLIVTPGRFEAVSAMLGGSWTDTGDEVQEGGRSTCALPMGRRLGSVKYHFRVYARVEAPSPGQGT